MKIILLSSAIFLMAFKYSANHLNTEVKAEIIVNENGNHYTFPFLIKLHNPTSKSLTCQLYAGTVFYAGDEGEQNFILAEDLMLTLNPGASIKKPVRAYCIESTDRAPGFTSKYKIGDVDPRPNMQTFAKFIAKRKIHVPETQYAFWTLADGKPLEHIAGYRADTAVILQNELARITGLPIPPKPDPKDYNRNYDMQVAQYKVRFNGKIDLTLSKDRKVHVALINRNGTLEREIFKTEMVEKGKKIIEYTIDASYFPDSLYYVQTVVDDQVWMKNKLKMPRI